MCVSSQSKCLCAGGCDSRECRDIFIDINIILYIPLCVSQRGAIGVPSSVCDASTHTTLLPHSLNLVGSLCGGVEVHSITHTAE